MQFGAPQLTRGVRDLLIVSFAVYAVQILPLAGGSVMEYGALVPSLAVGKGQVWRTVTYMFLHDPQGPWHLVFNMLALWMFGIEIEERWGTRRFVLFYLASGMAAGMASFLMWNTPIIGASGAVLALLTVYASYFPDRRVLMFFIFPMPVRIAVLIIGFISLAGSMSSAGGIAHLTHLGGIVVAFMYLKAEPLYGWCAAKLKIARRALGGQRATADPKGKQRYYEDVIDPILRKISVHGIESLTAHERETLTRASGRAGGRKQVRKIVPFDFSKDV